MIEVICEYVVKEEVRGQFELTFGPGGAWSELFGKDPGFRGINLLRDTKNPQRYLTIGVWDTWAQREQTLAERKSEYAKLETVLAELTESRIELGIFRRQTEATVRPQRSKRSIDARRKGRRSIG